MSWADRARKAVPPATTAQQDTDATTSPKPVSPPPPVVNYHQLPQGHLLTLPTEPLGSLLEYLPMGDVVKAARVCKRFYAVGEMDFIWQSQLDSMRHHIESMGFPFAELPRHFYMGSGSGSDSSSSPTTLTGRQVSETKRRVMATVKFHNHDTQRAVFLPDMQPVAVPGGRPPTGRFSFRRCDAQVKPEHERFLLNSLTTNFYGLADEPVRKLMDALATWLSFDRDREWGEEEVRSKFSLVDTTETEDPAFLQQLLTGISPHGPGGRGNPLHFGRGARLVEINFSLATSMLQLFGSSWMRTVFTTFHFDPKVTRYFTGPELCSENYIGIVVIDPLRVLLLRDRQSDYQPAHAGLMAYNQDDDPQDGISTTRATRTERVRRGPRDDDD